MGEVREIDAELGYYWDEQYVRREIAKECIYGVDRNGMAVELAKLSMWLETLAADRPLAFLDHHFKTGNSLVGSDVTEVLSEDNNGEDGQLTLSQALARVREDTLEHVMDLMEDLLAIDNETLQDVHSMEEIYAEIRADPLYQRLFELTNVHTAEQFGLNVPENAYEEMAEAIESREKWTVIQGTDWFVTAQTITEEQTFFHWELEFPEMFFGMDGERIDNAGFDAVIGNPPYVNIVSIPDDQTDYLRSYRTAFRRFDLYVLSSELGLDITRNGGYHSYITPDKLLTESYAQRWRKEVLEDKQLQQVLDLRNRRVFDDVTNFPIVYAIRDEKSADDSVVSVLDASDSVRTELSTIAFSQTAGYQIRIDWDDDTEAVLDSIRTDTEPLSRVMYASWGAQPGNDDRFVFQEDQPDLDNTKPLLKGSDIHRYRVDYQGRYLWYDRDELHRPAFAQLFENEKICIRKVAGKQGLIASFDDEQYYTEDSVINLIRKSDLVQADDDVLSARGIEVVDEDRPIKGETPSLVYDRDSTIYPDDLDLSTRIAMRSVLGVLNSSVIEYYYKMAISGQLNVFPEHIRVLPFVYDNNLFDDIETRVDSLLQYERRKSSLNLHLPDYFTNYSDGPTLGDLASPSAGVSGTLLTKTTADTDRYEKLRIDSVEIDRDDNDLTLSIVPYVKPVEDVREEYDTNSRDYATLDPIPAMEFRGLDSEQADLIESFVPYAVSEADGFAGFRDGATKTITLLDRLEDLTLPALGDVRDGLADYREETARAAELDEKIEHTDDLIDQIVYELYGLTDEEIEIVEEAVGD
jgi:hypothetical protein